MTRSKTVKEKINNACIKALDPEIRRVNDSTISGFHFIVTSKGKITYYVFYRLNGKQVNFKLGSHPQVTPQQARDLAKQKLGEVANGVDVQAEKKEQREKTERDKQTKLSIFLEKTYLPYQEARNPKTADRIIKSIKAGFPHLLEKQLADISANQIEVWRNEKRKSGMKEATINGYVSSLKALLNRAVEWDLIEKNNLENIKKLRSDNKRIRFLNDDEQERLKVALEERTDRIKKERDNANLHRVMRNKPTLPEFKKRTYIDHLTPIVHLAMYTGMRKGEILSLKWDDVDLKNKTITVQPENAKSGKRRHIPTNAIVLKMLKTWKKESGTVEYVFENEPNRPLADFKKAWMNLLKEADITNFRFHDLRHHFASMLVMKSVDLNTIRELLGHSTIEMTLRYAHLAPDHKAAAIELLD